MDNRQDCPFCSIPSALVIRELKHWTIALSDDQAFLGRCVIIHRTHIEDPLDTSLDERKEFWEAVDNLHDALMETLQPDNINWAFLGNTQRHARLEVIPRYAVPRRWSGMNFEDHGWGGPPWPSEKRELKPELLLKLRDEIAAALTPSAEPTSV